MHFDDSTPLPPLSEYTDRLADVCRVIDQETARQEPDWIRLRRQFHCAPEPSGAEFATTARIVERLEAAGLSSRIPDRKVGVIAELELGNVSSQTPVIALRADIDALRMADHKTVSYASQRPELAHTCGHDVHTTIVLGAAELLAQVRRQLSKDALPAVTIRFLFQAAEETCQGAAWMVEDGALDCVHYILGLHVEPAERVGRIGIRYGVLTAQVDEVAISIHGRGGHTARPHHTTDPIAAAAMLVCNLYQLLPRTVDVRDSSVFTVGQIIGGTASNVIPDEVSIQGTLRTTDCESRERLLDRIRSMGEHLGQLTGNDVTVEFRKPLGSVRNDATATNAFEVAARHVLGDSGIVRLTRPSMGGEDFAVYLDHVPGAQIRLGCAGDAPNWPLLHSPVFDVDERAISLGARVLVRAALLLALAGATPGH